MNFFLRITLFAGLFSINYGCNYFKKNEATPNAIVRVENDYLYRSDIEKILPKNYTLEDSIRIVSTYINNWALKKLLLQKAEENIPDAKKSEFENLVTQYRTDLYTQSYLDMLVSKEIDTIIPPQKIQDFYNENAPIFRLDETLLKFRYIKLNAKDPKNQHIIQRFKKFEKKDKKELNSLSLHIVSSFLNDSIWVKTSEVYEKLPFLESKLNGKSGILNLFWEETDSTNVYAINVKEVLQKNSQAPLEYALPTVKQIFINRKKHDYINELENDIIKKAIKKKQFQIYE